MLDTTPAIQATGQTTGLQVRRATLDDLEALDEVRVQSLSHLLVPMLTEAQRATLWDLTPLDPRLVEDGTYYLAEVDGRVAASGGWSRRRVLFRTVHDPAAAEDAHLDPATDAAIIRAMFTHPDFARRGLGALLLTVAEAAARIAGFARAELMATPTGVPLYAARGWHVIDRPMLGPCDARGIQASRMAKLLT